MLHLSHYIIIFSLCYHSNQLNFSLSQQRLVQRWWIWNVMIVKKAPGKSFWREWLCSMCKTNLYMHQFSSQNTQKTRYVDNPSSACAILQGKVVCMLHLICPLIWQCRIVISWCYPLVYNISGQPVMLLFYSDLFHPVAFRMHFFSFSMFFFSCISSPWMWTKSSVRHTLVSCIFFFFF